MNDLIIGYSFFSCHGLFTSAYTVSELTRNIFGFIKLIDSRPIARYLSTQDNTKRYEKLQTYSVSPVSHNYYTTYTWTPSPKKNNEVIIAVALFQISTDVISCFVVRWGLATDNKQFPCCNAAILKCCKHSYSDIITRIYITKRSRTEANDFVIPDGDNDKMSCLRKQVKYPNFKTFISCISKAVINTIINIPPFQGQSPHVRGPQKDGGAYCLVVDTELLSLYDDQEDYKTSKLCLT